MPLLRILFWKFMIGKQNLEFKFYEQYKNKKET